MRTNILIMTCRLPFPPDDGWKIRCFNLIKGLADHEFTVDLLTFVENPTEQLINEGLKMYCRNIYTVPRTKHYSPVDLFKGLVTSTPFPVLNYYSPQMAGQSVAIMTRNHYDYIQVEDIMMCQYLNDSRGRTLNCLDMHNIQSRLMRRYGEREKNPAKKMYAFLTANKLKRYEIETTKKLDVFLVCSEEDRHILSQWLPDSYIKIVPNGVDTHYFTPGTEKVGENNIVFIGDMSYHANISGVSDFVERIFPRIKKAVPSVRFWVVGKNPSKRIQAYGNDSIVITGEVEDVRPYLRSAGVVVIPLLVGGGTRLKILEAMAMGKAIVSTSVGSEGIPVIHGKNILIADDPESFAAQVVYLLNDSDRQSVLGRKARRFIEGRYDWSSISQKHIRIYTTFKTNRFP